MAKAKRSREASPEPPNATQKWSKGTEEINRSSSGASSLDILAVLPSEIVVRILEHACFSAPLPTARSLASPRPAPFVPRLAYDGKTVINLLTASRSVYALIVKILYTNVRLTRPSALGLFHQTLRDNPELRRQVKRINIGPQDELPEHWWPITDKKGQKCVAFGLQGSELAGLPSSLPRTRHWRTNDPAAACLQGFLLEAIGISPHDPLQQLNRLPSSTPFEMRSWLLSIFEAQAKLDLYALELRRIQDEGRGQSELGFKEGCRVARCRHYPNLAITDDRSIASSSSSLSGRAELNFFLPGPHLRAHLARRGSLTDRFDHPLLFARSELSVCRINDEGQPEFEYTRTTRKLTKKGFREAVQPNATTSKGVVALILAVKELAGLEDEQMRIWPEVLAESVRIRAEHLATPEEVEEESAEEEGENAGDEDGQGEDEEDELFADAVDVGEEDQDVEEEIEGLEEAG